MKRILSLVLVLVLALSMAACAIAETTETAETAAETVAVVGVNARMTVCIVFGTCIGIGEYGIRFVYLLELDFGFLIAGIDIGMILLC